MSKKPFYRQCELERGSGEAIEHHVSWLPEKHAVVGKLVKLKNEGRWTYGWKVIAVGEILRSEKEVVARSQDYRSQRGGSDI